ncbi:MAG: hypothetical protein JWN04_5014 [Myxococcaceae bacterium]|nr:hypothetical protein [Myxococcaceae bacterium]
MSQNVTSWVCWWEDGWGRLLLGGTKLIVEGQMALTMMQIAFLPLTMRDSDRDFVFALTHPVPRQFAMRLPHWLQLLNEQWPMIWSVPLIILMLGVVVGWVLMPILDRRDAR